jgi:hypothetical protein
MQMRTMAADEIDDTVRRAIGGDARAVEWIRTHVDSSDHSLVVVMAALLDRDARWLDRAQAMATTSRDRQVVEVARAHLDGRVDQVDALARDHLVDHPDSLLVAWVAAGAAVRRPRDDGS